MKPSARRSARVSLTALLAVASAPATAQSRPAAAVPQKKSAATVVSKDGTTIAYERSGSGPALVLVASALSTRSDATRLAALLASSFTVFNYDRRGRGESGDAKAYAVEREIEDIDALVEEAGGRAFLFGSSSGAVLALEAAHYLGAKVPAQVLFEPPFIVDDSRPPIPDGFFERVGKLVAANRRGDAVAQFMTEGIGVPEDMVAGMKKAPMWAGLEQRAHTLLYDGAIMAGLQSGKPLPAKRWNGLAARTLVIDGELSPPFLRNAVRALTDVLPRAERRTLPGQDHSAVFTAPATLVPPLVEFLGSAKPAEAKGESRASTGVK